MDAIADSGYIAGRDVEIEQRFADGRSERFAEVASEIVGLGVDLIALVGAVTARAAMKATTSIPIVFAVVVDPVADGVVASLERPGGHVSGVTSFDPQQPRKQLEILKEAVPALTRVALLGDASVSEALLKANEEQARALGLVPTRLRLTAPNIDIEGVLTEVRRQDCGALVALEEPAVVLHRKRIAELAAKERLPTMFARDWADAGGLIAYGTSVVEAARCMAPYVDKILKGANAGDLPVKVVSGHELIFNLKTAREIGVTIPQGLLRRANRVIQESG